MDELAVFIERLNAREQSSNKVIVFAASMFLTTSIAYTLFQFSDVNTIFSAGMPSPWLLFDYCTARGVIMFLSKYGMLPVDFASEDPYLIRDTQFGNKTRNMRVCVPIGLSNGVDINCTGPQGLLKLGFGFLEIGPVSINAQNSIDEARISLFERSTMSSINRKNASEGLNVVSTRLCDYIENSRPKDLLTRNTVTGILIVLKTTNDVETLFANTRLIHCADYITLDCPLNTETIKKIDQCASKFASIPPIYIQVTEESESTSRIIETILASQAIVGVCVNGQRTATVPCTTQAFPTLNEPVHVSGFITRQKSTETVSTWYKLLGEKKEIIASGGVACGKDALDKIEAGASMVQILTAFTFEGAQIARRIKTQLSVQLMNKGYYNIDEAIGAKHREKSTRMKNAMKRRKRF